MPNKIVAAVEKHPVIASVVVGGIGILATIYFVQKSQGSQNSVTGVPTDAAGNPLTGGFTVSPPLGNTDLATMMQDMEQQILDWEQQFEQQWQSQNGNGSGNNSSGNGSSNQPPPFSPPIQPTGFPIPAPGGNGGFAQGGGGSGGGGGIQFRPPIQPISPSPTGFPIPLSGGMNGSVPGNPVDVITDWMTRFKFRPPIQPLNITGIDGASHGGSIISSPAFTKKWSNLNHHIWGGNPRR